MSTARKTMHRSLILFSDLALTSFVIAVVVVLASVLLKEQVVPPGSDVDNLCVCGVVPYFNPALYKSRLANFQSFRKSSKPQGLWLMVIELAFDDHPFQIRSRDAEHLVQIRGNSSSHLLWQKERLLNIAIKSLPKGCKNVAWIDADLLFLNSDWVTETCQALDKDIVVQLFEAVYRLSEHQTNISEVMGIRDLKIGKNKSDTTMATRGFAYSVASFGVSRDVLDSQEEHGFTGFAWAARRSMLEEVRLFDKAIVGGADALMAHAFVGHFHDSDNSVGVGYDPYFYKTRFPPGLDEYKKAYLIWTQELYARVQGRVGYVNGVALHLWHGSKKNRHYESRFRMLRRARYNPNTDIAASENTLIWEWCSSGAKKDKLHKQVAQMFLDRREDGDRNAK